MAFFIAHIFYTALFFRYARDPDGSGKVVIDGLTLCCIAMAWLFLWHWSGDISQVILGIAVIVVMSIAAALLVPSTVRILFFGAVCTDGFCLVHCVWKSKK